LRVGAFPVSFQHAERFLPRLTIYSPSRSSMGVMMTELVYSEAVRKSPPLASRAFRHHQLAWYNAAMSNLRNLQPTWPEQPRSSSRRLMITQPHRPPNRRSFTKERYGLREGKMHRTCGLISPQLRGLENEPMPRRGDHPCSARVSDPAGTPDRRSPFLRSSQPRRAPEDLRSCHGRVRRPLLLTSLFFRFRRSGSQCAVHGPAGSIMFPR
jgi:hypothetical protein